MENWNKIEIVYLKRAIDIIEYKNGAFALYFSLYVTT